jgi:hypothetical protein
MTLPTCPLRCPDWRAAHCLGTLGNSSGPPQIGNVPVRSSQPSRPLVLVCVRPFRDSRRLTIVFVINRVCCLIVNRKGMDVNVSSVSAPAARLG